MPPCFQFLVTGLLYINFYTMLYFFILFHIRTIFKNTLLDVQFCSKFKIKINNAIKNEKLRKKRKKI